MQFHAADRAAEFNVTSYSKLSTARKSSIKGGFTAVLGACNFSRAYTAHTFFFIFSLTRYLLIEITYCLYLRRYVLRTKYFFFQNPVCDKDLEPLGAVVERRQAHRFTLIRSENKEFESDLVAPGATEPVPPTHHIIYSPWDKHMGAVVESQARRFTLIGSENKDFESDMVAPGAA